ncbi:hypothetical protein CC86DRAFT_342943 [Ophiobolus disseminans]|uniref:GDP-mannose transporter n=1 Tax=Ophiobolus disseminans TaxID=1469910 RepID=A0A6A7AAY3_9PLEO|nr:hypothetical protein CC86DRAFT_342943 [Ophiobolus disseminans]
MNSLRFNRSSKSVFRKPLDFLTNIAQPDARKKSDRDYHRRKHSASSLDDTDHSDVEQYAQMEGRRSHSTQNSQSELQPPVPLIDIGSRSTSPYPRSRSAVQSEDEDDEYETASSIRPLVGHGRGGKAVRGITSQGGLGHFLFATWAGWQVWVGFLVFWVGGCQFGLLLMNRFIMLTGIYKFPFPLTGTFVQLVLTHMLLIGFSSLTRALDRPLRWLGLGPAVAPSFPIVPRGAHRGGNKKNKLLSIARWLSNGSGGIAGGGLFEFDWQVAKQVLPLTTVFIVKVVLSNFSFAYAPLPTYQLARIGITPISILFTCILSKENISGSTLSAALVATLNLLFATIRSNVRVTWESIVAGVLSSIFVALYPILLLRTYRGILAGLVPQGDALTAGYPSSDDVVGNREETRAYYRTLHYTSLLSLILLTPIVLLFGDVRHIWHNIPFLDVPFFWSMMLFGGMGSWAVFSSTLLLVKATSPLTTTFVSVPRTAFQLAMINLFKIPAPSWVGVVLCWISSVWYLVGRREEGRVGVRRGLEGR